MGDGRGFYIFPAMKGAAKLITILLFGVYLLLLIKLTLFRTSVFLFDINFSGQNGYITSFETAYDRANFVPFYSIYYYLISKQEPFVVGLINVLGNIVLFIPFGLFLPLIWSNCRRWKKLTLVLFLVSISLEVAQLLFAIGNFDIDDTLLNVVGGWIGYLLFAALFRLLSLNRA